MGNIKFCQMVCSAEEKVTEDSNQFLKKRSPHNGQKAYFDDLCEDFIQQLEQYKREWDQKTLMTYFKNKFENFKNDISVTLDLHLKNFQMLIKTKAKDDEGLQLYLSVIQKDIRKIQECASVFYMFDQPAEGNDYSENSINMTRIDHMDEQSQGIIKRGYEPEKELIINKLNDLQGQIQAVQIVSNIHLVEVLEAQQRVIQLLFDQLIKQDDLTDSCVCHKNTKLEQHSLQDSIQQIKISSFQNKLVSLKETSDADFQSLIVKMSNYSKQALDQNEITLNNNKVALQKVKNELQATQQTLIERDGLINTLQASLQELKQNEIKVVPLTNQLFSLSPQHKSIHYTITSPNIFTKTGADGNDLAVMVPALNLKQGKCMTFGFKIKKNQSNLGGYLVGMCNLNTIIQNDYSFNGQAQLGATAWDLAVMVPALNLTHGICLTFSFKIKQQYPQFRGYAVGMCHKDTIIQKEYSFLYSIGHGCYMVALNGNSFSTIDMSINAQYKSFQFKTNDTIFCTVNPTNETITFRNSSSNESFAMNYKPTAQQLHPCVYLYNTDNQVEYLQQND